MTDRVMEHGRSLDGLAPSTYELTLKNYLATGYPVGSFLPLGVGGEPDRSGHRLALPALPRLPRRDAGALLLLALHRASWRSRAARALVATIASQPALLFAYSLWGGVKEIAAAWILALLAALLAALVLPRTAAEDRARALLPGRRRERRRPRRSQRRRSGLARTGAAGRRGRALPHPRARSSRCGARRPFSPWLRCSRSRRWSPRRSSCVAARRCEARPSSATSSEPLSSLQFFGIWPSGDFRVGPDGAGHDPHPDLRARARRRGRPGLGLVAPGMGTAALCLDGDRRLPDRRAARLSVGGRQGARDRLPGVRPRRSRWRRGPVPARPARSRRWCSPPRSPAACSGRTHSPTARSTSRRATGSRSSSGSASGSRGRARRS